VNAAVKAAGIAKPASCYAFRHSFAGFIPAGQPAHAVATRLHHALSRRDYAQRSPRGLESRNVVVVHDSIAELERSGRELEEQRRVRVGEMPKVIRQVEPERRQCRYQGIASGCGYEIEVARLVLVVGIDADGAPT
jgi:hypothetical protein